MRGLVNDEQARLLRGEGSATGGRVLSAAEVDFCRDRCLAVGFDVDDDEPQLCHVCWPYRSCRGALCATDRLWFQGSIESLSSLPPVSCARCLELLADLMRAPACPECGGGLSGFDPCVPGRCRHMCDVRKWLAAAAKRAGAAMHLPEQSLRDLARTLRRAHEGDR